jgi:hypothetical protein
MTNSAAPVPARGGIALPEDFCRSARSVLETGAACQKSSGGNFRARESSSRRCSSAKAISARKSFRKELGFISPQNLKLKTQNSTCFYCKPVGSHESMTKVILSRASEVVKKFPVSARAKKIRHHAFRCRTRHGEK